MVDLENHRIIDIINSRETKQVEEWLKSYPNPRVISHDAWKHSVQQKHLRKTEKDITMYLCSVYKKDLMQLTDRGQK